MPKKALITGITGQDGSYLAEFLLHKGYEVHGIIRRASTFNTKRIDHLYKDPHNKNIKMFLHYGDTTDSSNLNRILEKVQPDEIYNLAAQSHVKVSFEVPEYTAEVDGVGNWVKNSTSKCSKFCPTNGVHLKDSDLVLTSGLLPKTLKKLSKLGVS